MRDERVSLGPRERVRGANRQLEPGGDEARRALVRAARAVERAGLELEWVRRLAKRLAKLREGRGARRARVIGHVGR